MATPGSIRRYLPHEKNAANFDPRKFYRVAADAMQIICQARYEAFGSAGHAGKIKVIPLDQMVERYASGELDPKLN